MSSKEKTLKSKAKNALAWDLAGSFLRQAVSLGITILLARLLAPEQFGIIGMSLIFITVTQVFIDVGFTDGLIQKKDASDVAYSSIFYINIAISVLLAVIIFFAAPYIGVFYENAQVTVVLRWLSVVPVIGALGKVHGTILVKNLNFKSLNIRDIVATIAGGIAGVIAAFNGQGVLSLVWQQIVTALVGTISLWFSSNWRPKLIFSLAEVRALFSYSSYIFLDQFMRNVFDRIDTLFIGKVFSPAILGFYTRAESLNAQINSYCSNSLRKIVFPILSTVQDDDERFKTIYFKVFNLASVVSSSIAGVLFFLSDKIILGLLGGKWAPSIVIFQILVFKTLTSPFGALLSKALLSKGFSKVKFNLSIVQRLIMFTPLTLGYLYNDITVFVIIMVIANVVAFIVNAYVVYRYLHLSFAKQLSGFFVPLVPLFGLYIGYKQLFPEISSWILAIIFIALQWIFFIATKNAGYQFILHELKPIVSKVKNSMPQFLKRIYR
ncbi:lipopolysaccharide biosynthesis protein [Flavobacterium sp. MFBS3-15]|uniref:lipopolysaccharide biosynthesis protein n=1 Tax=Flavobacterium sp. MFBS3-15 TaxID=2989816 RepID=UPI0022363E55|nr:lipopolysaccharide biosynthesis protein [Flavobacterium sp. MFBS3-15]MCW4469562.1 lipopolysaccharide biosynthesis protein [Flavobacterium sp. MFBS3-15]